jgi:DNA-binding NarL/FixJ family response regulator
VIRVMLVDDQELVRAGLRGILRDTYGFEIVAECGDGSEAVDALRRSAPDVVLMDVRMPVMDGVRATQQLRAEDTETPILALTTFDDDEALAGMLRAGASGFILKGVAAEELQQAVRVVAGGGAWLDPAVTRRVLDGYRTAPESTDRTDDRAMTLLTDRERDVLVLIGEGHTNAEIAQTLFVGEGTVKTHINHLFSKLNLRDRAAAVIFAYEHGLVGGSP